MKYNRRQLEKIKSPYLFVVVGSFVFPIEPESFAAVDQTKSESWSSRLRVQAR
jgi:hypothetical protein